MNRFIAAAAILSFASAVSAADSMPDLKPTPPPDAQKIQPNELCTFYGLEYSYLASRSYERPDSAKKDYFDWIETIKSGHLNARAVIQAFADLAWAHRNVDPVIGGFQIYTGCIKDVRTLPGTDYKGIKKSQPY